MCMRYTGDCTQSECIPTNSIHVVMCTRMCNVCMLVQSIKFVGMSFAKPKSNVLERALHAIYAMMGYDAIVARLVL